MPRSLHLSDPSEDDDVVTYTVSVDHEGGPALIGITVSDGDYSVIHWPDAVNAVTVIDGAALPAENDAAIMAAWNRAIEALPDMVQLVYIQHDEVLPNEQITEAFAGKDPYEQPDFDEWLSDVRYGSAMAVLQEYVDKTDYKLLADTGRLDDLRFELEGRDTSDPFADLLRNTSNKYLRYRVDYEVSTTWSSTDEEFEAEVAGMAAALGLDAATHRDTLRGILNEAGSGGNLWVFWRGDIEDLVNACQAFDSDTGLPAQTIRWEHPEILVLDSMNGSGYAEPITATITMPFNRENLLLDAKGVGFGYAWSDVAGVWGDTNTTVTITTDDDNGE